MDERDFEEFVTDALLGIADIDSIITFDDAGLLTMNKGLVVRFINGAEFQLTIVQSERGDDYDDEWEDNDDDDD